MKYTFSKHVQKQDQTLSSRLSSSSHNIKRPKFTSTFDLGFDNKREVGRQTTSNFETVTREKLFSSFVKKKNEVPNCCSYRVRHQGLDKKVVGPVYGDSSKWDNHLKEQSKQIKDKDFANKTKWCRNIDRTLVHVRPNMLKQIINTQQQKIFQKQKKALTHIGVRTQPMS